MASLDLDNPVVRERMLSPEFLDAARFAHVGRVASEFDGDERRAISAGGELSMHGGGDTLGWDVTLEALVEFVEQVA
ncbi:MAG: hypothetical protein KY463_02465 [Actinobacteria bacterium]|nr:hypothetical protein [Actinomycetota bacterium]